MVKCKCGKEATQDDMCDICWEFASWGLYFDESDFKVSKDD